jgi:hypothetical protein
MLLGCFLQRRGMYFMTSNGLANVSQIAFVLGFGGSPGEVVCQPDGLQEAMPRLISRQEEPADRHPLR